jgi:hypothetical protein
LKVFTKEGESEKGVRKDKHLARLFYTGDYWKPLHKQLAKDVNFLKDHNLMDYSLLIGVHHLHDDAQPMEPDPNHPAVMGKNSLGAL